MEGDVGATYRLFVSLAVLWIVIMPLDAWAAAPVASDIWDLSPMDADEEGSEDQAHQSAQPQKPSWIDSSHDFFTERSNNLTRWIDSYFGGTEVDQEVAPSRLRLRFISD